MLLITPLKCYFLRITSFFFAFFWLLNAAAQDKLDAVMSLMENKPQERLYTAYSKTQYVAGETIRFKTFVFTGYHLSHFSTNLYVEFLNKNKSIIDQKIFPIIGGIAEGSIDIPDSLPENVYYFRAFTQRMLNSEETLQYVKPIVVYNEKSYAKLKKQNRFWSAAFVEGGSLLANKQATVAVRLYSTGKLPDSWKGYLTASDDTAKSILSFASLDPNVATFSFVPEMGKQYISIIEDDNGNKLKASLPIVLSKGVNMQTNLQNNTLEYMLDFSNVPLNETYRLVGTINNDIVYKASFKNKDSFIVHSFPTSEMPRGILRLTLFNDGYHPLTERLVFLPPAITKSPPLELSTLNAAPGGFNKLKMRIDSGNSFNLIITDAAIQNVFEKENLVSAFWLTSIFDDIQNGSAYFSNESKVKNGLDAVLISEIEKLPRWTDLFNKKQENKKNKSENFLTYAARVYYRNKPLVNEPLTLMLFSPDSTRQIFQVVTDSTGGFLMEGFVFEGKAKLSFQSGKKKRLQQDIRIEIIPAGIQNPNSFSLPPTSYVVAPADEKYMMPEEVKRSLENLKNEKLELEKFKTLNAVFVKSKMKSATEKLYKELTGSTFPLAGEMIYDFVNLKQAGTGGTTIYQWLNNRESFTKYTRFFVDAMQADLNWVNTIYTADVALAKVAREGGTKTVRIYLNHGRYGNYAGVTRPDDQIPVMQGVNRQDTIGLTYLNKRTTPYQDSYPSYYNYSTTINNVTLEGYGENKPIYKFDYKQGDSSTSDTDTRALLYWSYLFESNKNENVQEIFFNNNGSAKNFRIIVLGFKDEETPLYSEQVTNIK